MCSSPLDVFQLLNHVVREVVTQFPSADPLRDGDAVRERGVLPVFKIKADEEEAPPAGNVGHFYFFF